MIIYKVANFESATNLDTTFYFEVEKINKIKYLILKNSNLRHFYSHEYS